jgi:DNA (cytosine-5)-methyltransferase 1
MSAFAYYNEIDPFCAQWLRNLIAAGHIAPGTVDERSIEDVCPDDLNDFKQCHFFAGIGIWSLALRRAGWPDDRPAWTGSCPCQPFSQAGAGAGFDDDRHLWPDFAWLIQERRPAVVFGEQVSGKPAEPWLDLVSDDLERMGYAFGAIAFPAASVGAPHIRDRVYWLADADHTGLEGRPGMPERAAERAARARGLAGRLADANGERFHTPGASSPQHQNAEQRGGAGDFWTGADWISCRDGKSRPIEPGTFPLAAGAPARVGRLRAYGNSINAEAARHFIACAMPFLNDSEARRYG